MKNKIIIIAEKLKQNTITENEAETLLLDLFGVIKPLPFQGVTWELYDKLHTDAINKRKAELKGNVL